MRAGEGGAEAGWRLTKGTFALWVDSTWGCMMFFVGALRRCVRSIRMKRAIPSVSNGVSAVGGPGRKGAVRGIAVSSSRSGTVSL